MKKFTFYLILLFALSVTNVYAQRGITDPINITTGQIADKAVTEPKLSQAVQDKLNAAGGNIAFDDLLDHETKQAEIDKGVLAESWGDHALENYLKGITSESIGSLSDVNTTGIADLKILKYNLATSKFIIADDANTLYNAGAGLNLMFTTFSWGSSGTSGKLAKWTGTYQVGDAANTDAEVSDAVTHSKEFRQVLSASTASDTVLYVLDGARTTYYDMTLTGDARADTVIFNDGKTPQDGDSLILRVIASGAGRTISFLEGGDGTFLFGTSLVALDISETVQDETDYIGCTWNDSKNRWLLISYSKGY